MNCCWIHFIYWSLFLHEHLHENDMNQQTENSMKIDYHATVWGMWLLSHVAVNGLRLYKFYPLFGSVSRHRHHFGMMTLFIRKRYTYETCYYVGEISLRKKMKTDEFQKSPHSMKLFPFRRFYSAGGTWIFNGVSRFLPCSHE